MNNESQSDNNFNQSMEISFVNEDNLEDLNFRYDFEDEENATEYTLDEEELIPKLIQLNNNQKPDGWRERRSISKYINIDRKSVKSKIRNPRKRKTHVEYEKLASENKPSYAKFWYLGLLVILVIIMCIIFTKIREQTLPSHVSQKHK